MTFSFHGADRDVTGTLARTLIDGGRRVKLFGFSAHADRDERLTWQQALKPDRTILVHDDKAMHGFATQRQGTEINMPDKGDEILL